MTRDDLALTRRQLLSRCGMGFGALALGGMMADASDPLTPRAPRFPGRAKRLIHVFANGGASQVDTFDPKPALAKYAGKALPTGNLKTERKTGAAFPSPWAFRKPTSSAWCAR